MIKNERIILVNNKNDEIIKALKYYLQSYGIWSLRSIEIIKARISKGTKIIVNVKCLERKNWRSWNTETSVILVITES